MRFWEWVKNSWEFVKMGFWEWVKNPLKCVKKEGVPNGSVFKKMP